jgi:hypothetical protein
LQQRNKQLHLALPFFFSSLLQHLLLQQSLNPLLNGHATQSLSAADIIE